MKRVLAWLAGLVGIAALGRWLAGRSHGTAEAPLAPPTAPPGPDATAAPSAPESADDPAAELRRKLAESRAAADGTAAPAEPREETLDERRARVHAQARATIDAMADDGTP